MYTEIVALLGSNNVGAIFALQDLLGAVLDQLVVTFYAGGDEDACLGLGSADVEGDIVKVGDDLVDGSRGGSVQGRPSVGLLLEDSGYGEAYSGAKRSLRIDSMSTF